MSSADKDQQPPSPPCESTQPMEIEEEPVTAGASPTKKKQKRTYSRPNEGEYKVVDSTRGLWICMSPTCFRSAEKEDAVQGNLKCKVSYYLLFELIF